MKKQTQNPSPPAATAAFLRAVAPALPPALATVVGALATAVENGACLKLHVAGDAATVELPGVSLTFTGVRVEAARD